MKLQTILTTLVTAVTMTAFAAVTVQVSASDTQEQISTKKSSNEDLVAQLESANTEVIKLNSKIDAKNAAIKDAQTKIGTTQARIDELKGEVAKAEAELAARKQVLKQQLISLQKQAGDSVSGNVYIDFILNSDDISDAIARTTTVNKLNSANKDALNAVNETKTKLDNLQSEQEAKKQNLETTKASLQSEKTKLEGLKAQADKKSDALNDKINANKAVLQALQEKAQKEDADAEAAKNALAKLSEKSATVGMTAGDLKAPASTPVASGTKTSSDSAGNAYPYGQCTWYVKSVAPWAGNHWGNGCQWGASAAAEGFTVNSTPAVGSIVVIGAGQNFGGWTADGQYGHVAYVVAVNGDSIVVQQGGMGFSSPAGPNAQTVSGAGSFTYIHR